MDDVLFLEELRKYDLLPGNLINTIRAKSTSVEKAGCFLDNVIDRSLGVDNVELLNNLLTVMSDEKDNKDKILMRLSAEMQEELDNETSLITKKGTGCYKCAIVVHNVYLVKCMNLHSLKHGTVNNVNFNSNKNYQVLS